MSGSKAFASPEALGAGAVMNRMALRDDGKGELVTERATAFAARRSGAGANLPEATSATSLIALRNVMHSCFPAASSMTICWPAVALVIGESKRSVDAHC